MSDDDDVDDEEVGGDGEDDSGGKTRGKALLLPPGGLLSKDASLRIWTKGKHSSVTTTFWILTEASDPIMTETSIHLETEDGP